MTTRADSVVVVGCGSIGMRHLANLRSLGVSRLAACDTDAGRLAAAADSGCETFGALGEALRALRPEAVVVCTPPSRHVAQAREAVASGAHVFVEKPLSHSLDGVDVLVAEVRASGRVARVGYNLRFDAGLARVRALLDAGRIGRVLWARAEYGQYLPDWRPGRDYRASYSAQRALGGGVLLDVSHELDYVTWLFGPPVEVSAMSGRVGRLDVDVDDCATVLMRFADGAQADVHVDFVQRGYSRSLKLAGEAGTIVWDFAARTVSLYDAERDDRESLAVGGESNDMYVAELAEFLDGGLGAGATLEEGRAVLALALRAGSEAIREESLAR